MRVAAIVPLYPPGSRVGAWLASHQLLRRLAARGHRVTVVPYLSGRGAHYDLDGVRVEPGANRQLAISRADVVIAHLGSPRTADALDHLTLDVPVVRIVHGLPGDAVRLARAQLVVANSQTTAAALQPLDVPLIVCRPVTDCAAVRTTAGDRVSIVNCSPAKGGDLFWRLAARMPDVGFLACRGGYGQQIERRMRNVVVVGPVRDVRMVYEQTRVLLVPSKAETWGMVGVEALCSGIPVIASDLPGLRESLGGAGNYPVAQTPEAWETMLRQLLTPRAWAGAAQRARRRARELSFEDDLTLFADSIEQLR